jgi:purine-binding chemotaxis protein CheW
MSDKEKDDAISNELAGKYLTFHLAGEVYGVRIQKVQEIIRMMKITRVPRAPHFVAGVINLRGKVIPVINMRLKFNLEKLDYDDRTCIIVAQIKFGDTEIPLGIIIDKFSEVHDLTPEQISKTPPMGAAVNTEFIMGIGKADEKIIMLLDLDKAFSLKELEAMASGLI